MQGADGFRRTTTLQRLGRNDSSKGVQVTPQITIRTAPEATRPRKGEDDGLRQASFLVPSCSPSLRCCGTCDDDDASPAASDPDHDGPDSVAYYPVGSTSSTPSPSPSSSPSPQPSSFIVVILDFELLGERDLIQFVHVEYYFNELNEFDHPSSSTSSTATSSSTPNTPVSTPDTKPSSTTGNSAPRTKTTGARKRRRPDHDCDHDDPKETTTKTTATATRRQWRRLRLRRQRGDHPTTSNSATTTRKEGRKAYIEQNDRRAATTDPVHPPENSKLLREPTNCGANYIRGPDSRPFNSSVSAGDYPDCDLKRRMSHEVYARPQPDSEAAHRYCHTAANRLIEHHRVGTRTCKSRVSLTPTAESVAKIGMESRLRAAKWGGKGKGGDRGGTSTHDHFLCAFGVRFEVRPPLSPEPDRTSQRFKVRPESPNRTRVRFGVREKRSPNRTAPDRGIPMPRTRTPPRHVVHLGLQAIRRATSIPAPTPRHCQHTAPPQHGTQDLYRQPTTTPPQHGTQRPATADPHATPTRRATSRHTPTHHHAKTPSPPTRHVAPTRCARPYRPATPLQRGTQGPSHHRPPRHPNTARNTPTHRHAKTPSPPTRQVAPTWRATPRRPVTTPTPSAPPYIHAIYNTSTSLQ
ncbi:hypothetical protein EDB85DRAFT_2174745 [Lactarius pseudohatsudake]|nr:hypothetical protein EDB85DRAFT_2174745 [Lactarius pseudohatsudake]